VQLQKGIGSLTMQCNIERNKSVVGKEPCGLMFYKTNNIKGLNKKKRNQRKKLT